MNKQLKKQIGALVSALFLFSTLSFSQISDVDFLKSGPTDGVKFLEAYISPWTNAFGAGLNGGWYNTAKPHKLLGFDITTSFNVGVVPSSADKFDVGKIGLTSLTGTGSASTISGPKTTGPSMSYQSNGVTLATFNAPKGTNFKYIPVPTLQIGVGLPFGSELKGRFIPKIHIRDGDISLWGIGLLHNLTQYLPGNKLLPFDVSLFGGYTKLEGNVGLQLNPGAPTQYTAPYDSPTAFDKQNLNINVSALNLSAIASLNLPVITFYGGLGYSKTKTDIALSGNYPTPTPILTAPYVGYNNTGVKKGADFPKAEIENFSGLRANIGFRIKLAVITIHADYTRAQYNVFSTGLGLSFR